MAQIFKKESLHQEQYIQIISDALPEAAEVLPCLSEEALDALREEAYQQGFDAGKKERLVLAQEELSLLKQRLEALFASITDQIEAHRINLEQDIAPIILMLMQEYLGEQLLSPQALQHQINQILKQINEQQHIELCLHPKDVLALQQANIKMNAQHIKGISIKSDDSLTLGGCLIKTEHGLFEASLEKQIDRLKDYLLQLKQRP